MVHPPGGPHHVHPSLRRLRGVDHFDGIRGVDHFDGIRGVDHFDGIRRVGRSMASAALVSGGPGNLISGLGLRFLWLCFGIIVLIRNKQPESASSSSASSNIVMTSVLHQEPLEKPSKLRTQLVGGDFFNYLCGAYGLPATSVARALRTRLLHQEPSQEQSHLRPPSFEAQAHHAIMDIQIFHGENQGPRGARLLLQHDYEREILRDVKAKLCNVALDFDTDMMSATESSDKKTTYEPPDSNIITMSSGASAARRCSSIPASWARSPAASKTRPSNPS